MKITGIILFVLVLSACSQDATTDTEHNGLNVEEDSSNFEVSDSNNENEFQANHVAEPTAETDSMNYAEVRNFVSTEMSEWKMNAPDDFSESDRSGYGSHNRIMNYIEGDFNCDGIEDFAVQLYKTQGSDHTISVWCLFLENGTFRKELVVEYEESGQPTWYGIVKIPKRPITDMYTDETVDMKCDGIESILFESASRIYYRTKKGYEYVQTSD